MLHASYSTKLFTPRARRSFPGYAFSLAAGLAVVFLAAALTACGSAPSPGTAECGVLCDASFWASATEAEVKAQLERDPDLSAKSGELGLTPLHMAASHTRNPAVIGLLLDAGADIGSTGDANGATPLHTASAFNPEPAVAGILLDRGADIAATNQYRGNAAACGYGFEPQPGSCGSAAGPGCRSRRSGGRKREHAAHRRLQPRGRTWPP